MTTDEQTEKRSKLKPAYFKWNTHGYPTVMRVLGKHDTIIEHYRSMPDKFEEITYAEYRAFREEWNLRHLHSVIAYVDYTTLLSIKRHAKEKGQKPGVYASQILEQYMRVLAKHEAESKAQA